MPFSLEGCLGPLRWAFHTSFRTELLSRSEMCRQSLCPSPPHPARPCAEVTSVPGVLFVAPWPWRTGGVRSGQLPSISLEPCLPPQFLQGPLGAQHISLDFIGIKEMSHICKQALLSQSPPAAVRRRRRRGESPVRPPSRGGRALL